MNAALLSSKNMNWCTPQDFFDRLDAEFHFVLDAAATEKSAKCAKFFTPETDGLAQSWDCGGGRYSATHLMDDRSASGFRRLSRKARAGILSFYLFRRGRIPPIFTITYTGKRKSASFEGGCASRMTTETPQTQHRSRQWS